MATGMSAAELAQQLDVSTNRVTEILNGRRAITGTTAEFWLTSRKEDSRKSVLQACLDVPSRWCMPDLDGASPPFLTINYRWKNSTLRLFSALTTFGTALDIALQELRIESFFPADENTRAVLTS
jgi:hypothetical protein